MDCNAVINTSHTGTRTVREETRRTWNALRAAGKVPSVRAVYAVIGGAYNTVCGECRMLRIEESLLVAVAERAVSSTGEGSADLPTPHPPLKALTQRVERLEQQMALFEDIRQLWRQCVRDRRTMKALRLWAQRTVGQTRNPLTNLVEKLACLD